MDLTDIENLNQVSKSPLALNQVEACISLETEMPEALYKEMNDFVVSNPSWDQYKLMSAALVNFLYQNGSADRGVTERYLNDIFNLSES